MRYKCAARKSRAGRDAHNPLCEENWYETYNRNDFARLTAEVKQKAQGPQSLGLVVDEFRSDVTS